jgi:hypothetical protein
LAKDPTPAEVIKEVEAELEKPPYATAYSRADRAHLRTYFTAWLAAKGVITARHQQATDQLLENEADLYPEDRKALRDLCTAARGYIDEAIQHLKTKKS